VNLLVGNPLVAIYEGLMLSEPHQRATGLLITGDLIFSTKIAGTARALGIEMQVVGSPQAAHERVREARPRCVIFDLGLSSLTLEAMSEIARAVAGENILAFGSHVDAERLQQARDAGCTEVMPRSRLSSELPELLSRYCQSNSHQG
jgi:DNA-binding NarL/FixJ family response regulator